MKRFLTLSVMSLLVAGMASAAAHLSASTQLFMAERAGEISLGTNAPSVPWHAPMKAVIEPERLIASPEVINGRDMVSAFVHCDPSIVPQLQAAGVIVQERFKTFVTAMVPADGIEKIAQINGVNEINVAQLVTPLTDMARKYTRAGDVIDYTTTARLANLPNGFTGKGVVVGIIDSGIDYNHKMFCDSAGNTRIKKLYVAKSSSNLADYTSDITSLTSDKSSSSHGTHTTGIAAGSSVTVDGITYGGMAPEANLAIVALSSYAYNTMIVNGIKNIFEYADQQQQPCVINMSLGTAMGAHDGTGEITQVMNQYAGSTANHIICISAGNNAGKEEWGAMHVQGEASASTPFATVINGYGAAQSNTYLNNYYAYYTWFYPREGNVELACKLHIVDTETDSILWTSSELTSGSSSVSGITTYFSSAPKVTFATDTYNKKQYIQLYYGSYITMKEPYTRTRYALGISIYPANDSTGRTVMIDGWDYAYNTFPDYERTINGLHFYPGSDDGSTSDWTACDGVISVGAYTTKNVVTDYLGESHTLDKYTVGDICYFSSYKTANAGPTTSIKPDICAPGGNVISSINHYEKSGYMANAYTKSGYYLTLNDGAASMGSMSGTSMSSPCAAGIIALYLQAAKSVDKTLNTEGIRDVFAHTAIVDNYTVKANFGAYGKIDALAGIKYILGDTTVTPVVLLDPDSVYTECLVGETDSAQFTVYGAHLNDAITLTLSDTAGVFSIDRNSVTIDEAGEGVVVTVKYTPTYPGHNSAAVVLSTPGATDTTLVISGFAPLATIDPVMLPADTNMVTSTSFTAQWTDETEPEKVDSYTLLVSLKPELVTLDSVDFTGTEASTKNMADSASKYLPEGWTAGTGFYMDGGCVSLRGTMTSAFYTGYSKISVVMKAKSYYSATTASLTISDGTNSQLLKLGTTFEDYVVVLDVNPSDTIQLSFAAENYPQIQSMMVYGGDYNDPDGEGSIPMTDETYRLVENITEMLQEVTGLRAGGTFDFKVKAFYVDGTESNWSNVERVTLKDYETTTLKRGDVNGDGNIDTADIACIVNIIIGKNTPDDYPGISDLNSDGSVSSGDVAELVAIITGS